MNHQTARAPKEKESKAVESGAARGVGAQSRGNAFAQDQLKRKNANDANAKAAADKDPGALFPPMDDILATSYADRLAAVESVGKQFPGLDKGEDVDDKLLEELGVFAGAHLQTRWQEKSGRGDNVWWSTLNYSLTIVPHKIAAEYAQQRTAILRRPRKPKLHSTSMPAAKITEDVVRQAWMTYFEVNDRLLAHDHGWSILGIEIGGDDLPSAQAAYWAAHVLSLKYAEHQYKADLEKKPPPPVEAEFRSAWWAMVELLDDANFSTKAGFSELALALTMPMHLLKDPKAVEDLPLTQEAFVRLLIATRRASVMIKGWLD
ncbi:MAG: hypothetical protein ACOZNI_22325 [Myxococcota bacterium]